MNTFWYVFGGIGIGAVVCIIGMFAYSAYEAIASVVQEWRWEYKYKHRFDKPPTAKCYCKDCVYHGKTGNDHGERCDLPGVDRFTPDNGFCYEARPMTAQEAKKRDRRTGDSEVG